MSILMIMGVIVLTMMVVSGDDTQALRDTISSLCSLNSVGLFASCCVSYDNGASLTLAYSPARECFIYSLASETGPLSSLFVIWFIFVLFLLFDDFHSFSSFFLFQEFSIQRTSCFREGCFLQSPKSQIPLLPSSHSLLHSFLPSLLSIILKCFYQQNQFN